MYRGFFFFCTEQNKQEHEKCTANMVHICPDDSEILKSSICEFSAASLRGEDCAAQETRPSGS